MCRALNAALCCVFGFIALPAGTAENSGESVETLIVTASRTPVPLAEIGSSVTVLERDYLAGRQNALLSEVLRGVPGSAVSRSGAPGSVTQLRVRGAEANQVLVLIDGIEANDPAIGGEFNFAHVLSDDVERVEIVRGPQSALWGSDALAGVVNILTRRGEPGVQGSAFVETGSFGTARGGASLGGAGDAWQFRFAASLLDSDGTNSSRQGGEKDGYQNATLGFSAAWQPLTTLSLQLSGRHVAGTNEYDLTDFLSGLPADGDLETQFEQDYGRMEARLDLFDGRWQHVVSASLADTHNDNLASGVSTDGTAGERTRLVYQTNLLFETAAPLPTEHTWSAAVEYEAEEFRQYGMPTAFGDPNQSLDSHSHALAGEYRLRLADRLSISAGLRHDWNSDFGDDGSWRLTAVYSPRDTGTRVRGSYGTGGKNPTFVERFGFFTPASNPFFIGNPELRPEQSDGWEIGAEQELADGRVRLALTWFNQDLEDEIDGFVFDPVLGAFTARNLDGRSRRHGLELAGRAGLAPGLELTATWSWLDATEPDALNGQQLREIRRPQHLANLNLDWRFAGDRARLNFNIDYNGEQLDVFFPPPSFAEVPVTLDRFVLMALAGSWGLSPYLEVFGRIENLLDDDYEEVAGYVAPGIGVFAGLRLSFGHRHGEPGL